MKLNACHNRNPFKERMVVQDGWYMDGYTRTPRMIAIDNPMSKDCQYSKDPMGYGQQDKGCEGCKWKASNE